LAGLSGNPALLGASKNLSFGTNFSPNVAILVGDRRVSGHNDPTYNSRGQGVYKLASGSIANFPGFSNTSGKFLQWGDRGGFEANAGIMAALPLSELGLTNGSVFQAAAIICGGTDGAPGNRHFSQEAYGGTLNGSGSGSITLTGLPVTLVTNEAPERSTAPLFTEEDVMLQGFYWDVPNGGSDTNWYVRLQNELNAGTLDPFTMIWMPPPSKGDSGTNSVGYDPYDYYDLGAYDWKGGIRTRYGFEAEQRACVKQQRLKNIQPVVDLVLNHMNGGEHIPYWGDGPYRYNYEYGPHHIANYHRRFEKINMNNSNNYFNVNSVNEPFGRDHEFGNPNNSGDINHRHPHQRDGLKAWGDWLTHDVGYTGYRFDLTYGIEPWFISEFMRGRLKKDRFAVMEYWEKAAQATTLENVTWLDLTDNTACLFDMRLHEKLADMCNGTNASFSMNMLASDSLIWERPERAVTFVESHDTIRPYGGIGGDDKLGIRKDKMLAYAFIMIAEGMPMVAYNDYLLGPYADKISGNAWNGTPLKSDIDQLIEIRREYVAGEMSHIPSPNPVHLFVLKRAGNEEKTGCILVLNDYTVALSDTVQTDWPDKILTDLISNATVTTDAAGLATLGAPARSYRIYVPTGDAP
jgi:alpha-amylase